MEVDDLLPWWYYSCPQADAPFQALPAAAQFPDRDFVWNLLVIANDEPVFAVIRSAAF
jgi:hypothetical protein